jgi:hypothetical protein
MQIPGAERVVLAVASDRRGAAGPRGAPGSGLNLIWPRLNPWRTFQRPWFAPK